MPRPKHPVRSVRRPASLALKRLLDVLGSFMALLLTSPFLVFIAFAIKLESRGAIFFRQVRQGRGDSTFRIFKFRTMTRDAERGGTVESMDDPRVTRVG